MSSTDTMSRGAGLQPPAGLSPLHRRRQWLAGAVAFSICLLGSSGGAQDWIYRVRPGDDLQRLAREYLRPDLGWEGLQKHNRIVEPGSLLPGSTLRFPIAWLRIQPAKARVVAVQGEVLVQPSDGGEAFAVETDMELGVGVTLSTGKDSNATLQFADGSRLLVPSDAAVSLDTLSAFGTTGMVDTRVRLRRGSASSTVDQEKGPGSRFVIETPGATSSVRG